MRKKWFFGILILVIVAVVLTIVFINLFKDKDTKALTEKINDVAENGYLADDSDEYLKINEYLSKMNGLFADGTEKNEVQNHKNAYKSFAVAIKFFNKEILFSSFTDVYNNNLKEITNNLNVAQENADKLKDYINETSSITGDSVYWNQNTWQTSRDYMKNIFDNTREAFSRLGKVYSASVNSVFVNNKYTDIILDGFNTLSNQVASKLSEDATAGTNLYDFTNAYYTDSNEATILGYVYNETLQSTVEDISEKGTESAYYNDFLAGSIQGRA